MPCNYSRIKGGQTEPLTWVASAGLGYAQVLLRNAHPRLRSKWPLLRRFNVVPTIISYNLVLGSFSIVVKT